MSAGRMGVAALAAIVTAACEPAPDDGPSSTPGAQQWKLPKGLREISGLALTPDARLLAVADESAVVYELDYTEGRVNKTFAVGDPALRGDFEGIAVAAGHVYLITSGGRIIETEETADGGISPFAAYETGLEPVCEVEGLDTEPSGALIIACKRMYRKAEEGEVRLYRWRPDTQTLDPDPVRIDADELARPLNENTFRPSGVAVRPGNGAAGGIEYLLVAAQQRAWATIDATGRVRAVARLPNPDNHRQSEGVAVTPQGWTIIADEGGKGRARLAVYRDEFHGG